MNSERPDNLRATAHELHNALQAKSAPAPALPITAQNAALQGARGRLSAQKSAAVQKLRDGFPALANGFAEVDYALQSQIALFERELRNQRVKRALLAPLLAVLVSLLFVGVAVALWFSWPYLQSFMIWLLRNTGGA